MGNISNMSPADHVRTVNARKKGKIAKNYITDTDIARLKAENASVKSAVVKLGERVKSIFGIKSEKNIKTQNQDDEPFGNAMKEDEFGNPNLDFQREIPSDSLSSEEKRARLERLQFFFNTLEKDKSEK